MIIKRKYPELEQREFGIIDGSKKLINKTRRNLAASVLKSARRDIHKQAELGDKIEENLKNSTKKSSIMKTLGKEANKRKVFVVKGRKHDKNKMLNKDTTIPSNSVSKRGKINLTKIDTVDNHYRKLGKALMKGDYVIVHRSDQSALAHEIGHVINRKGKLTKKISKINDITAPIYENSRFYRKGFKGAWKNYKDGTIQVIEESNASRNGLKLLKKSGATKEELEEAKRNMKDALEDYKLTRNISTKGSLYKTLKVPKIK